MTWKESAREPSASIAGEKGIRPLGMKQRLADFKGVCKRRKASKDGKHHS